MSMKQIFSATGSALDSIGANMNPPVFRRMEEMVTEMGGGVSFRPPHPKSESDIYYRERIIRQITGGKASDNVTLRDYFAAKAMQGILANDALLARYRGLFEIQGIDPDSAVAMQAYAIADAMLAERAK